MSKPVYKVIDSKGSVYIPKSMRMAMEVGCGDIVKLTAVKNGLQLQKVHLIEVGDHSPEAVEAYVAAAASAMSNEKQLQLAARLLAQLQREAVR